MRHIKLIFILLLTLSCIKSKPLAQNMSKTLVSYGKLDPTKIKDYELLIVEETHYTKEEVKILKSNNDKVIAYISLAEINSHAKYYDQLKDYTLGKNELWNSFHLDLSSPELRKRLLQIIKEIMSKGFDGLFLDNIDNACSFGPHPEHKKYVIDLIKQIRKLNNNIFLIQNSGLEIIKSTYKHVNVVALESVVTNYDFNTNEYRLRDESELTKRISDLNVLVDKYAFNVLLIEYADKKSLYNTTKEILSKHSYNYFIGNIDLQTIPKH